MSTGDQKITTIEASRGIAALLVVLFHSNLLCSAAGLSPFNYFFAFGDAGVDFFFVLSGFIMTLVYKKDFDSCHRAPNFVWRRFIRIYPTYWVVTLLYATPLLFIPWIRSYDLSKPLSFVLSNILLMPSESYLIIPPAWSLQYEMIFYLLFATLILNKFGGVFVITSWGLIIFFANALWHPLPFPHRMLLNPINLQFIIGMACATAVNRKFPFGGFVFLLGCMIFFGAVIGHARVPWFLADLPLSNVAFPMIKGLGAGLIITGLFWAEKLSGLKAPRILESIGSASYSIYLMHLPSMVFFLLVMIATTLLERLTSELVFLLLAGYGLTVGLIFYILIEKPIIRYLKS